MYTLESKLAKFAKPPADPNELLVSCAANGSLPGAKKSGVGEGTGGTGAARRGPVGPCDGRGGAGLGGGCFGFLGGNAGLGLSGRVGACKLANGSSPNGSFVVC